MSYSILTDSAANLPLSLANDNGIKIISLPYFIDGEENRYDDIEAFDNIEFFSAIKSGAAVTTSQINPATYESYMEPILEQGEDVLFIGLSSGVSGSFASAGIAKAELKERYPDRKIVLVDTLGASLGEGLVALKAAQLKKEGKSLEEAEEILLNYVKCMYQIFYVGDLMHLHRTGRVGGVSAIVGSVLGIKPLLKGNEQGKIVATEKHRGKKAVLNAVAEKYRVHVKNTDIIGISYTDNIEEAEELIAKIKEIAAPKEIILVKHEPATASHLGPGSLALYFVGDENVREH